MSSTCLAPAESRQRGHRSKEEAGRCHGIKVPFSRPVQRAIVRAIGNRRVRGHRADRARAGGPTRPIDQELPAVAKRKAPPRAAIVYIVDDDDAVRCGLAKLLQSAGLDPRPYGSAADFLASVANDQGACILLDITMPRMTGLQVQARLRELRIELPVITVSARDDEETRYWARSLGARMFLRKPVDDQALLDAISWVTTPGGQD